LSPMKLPKEAGPCPTIIDAGEPPAIGIFETKLPCGFETNRLTWCQRSQRNRDCVHGIGGRREHLPTWGRPAAHGAWYGYRVTNDRIACGIDHRDGLTGGICHMDTGARGIDRHGKR
jgi:hypothetical protein